MSSDTNLRSLYETLMKEKKVLQYTVEKLERENRSLKRSVYDLSVKLDVMQQHCENPAQRKPFNLKHLLGRKETKSDAGGTACEMHSTSATAPNNNCTSNNNSMNTVSGVRSSANSTNSINTSTAANATSSYGGNVGGAGSTVHSMNDNNKERLMASDSGGGMSLLSKNRELREVNAIVQENRSELSMKAKEKKASLSGSTNMNSFPCEDVATAKELEIDTEEEKKGGNRVIFTDELELRAHDGAVYVARFSPCGSYVATGSLDKEIFLWDMTSLLNKSSSSSVLGVRKLHDINSTTATSTELTDGNSSDLGESAEELNQKQKPIGSLSKHGQLVGDLSWSNSSDRLLSGSYDHTVCLWDVSKEELLSRQKELKGFVQTVSFNPADNDVYFAGTSQNYIYQIDSRENTINCWTNDAMINSLFASNDGLYVTTGDSKGRIKTWDCRTRSCLDNLIISNDDVHYPISHIHQLRGCDLTNKVAVNSYDSVIRVYDCPLKSNGLGQKTLTHFLTGHNSKNWPIKSSFFGGNGEHYRINLPKMRQIVYPELNQSGGEINSCESLLLATGSTDSQIYLYDLGFEEMMGTNTNLIQVLSGHTDRVYSVDFHPSEPVLVSASADFSAKVWIPKPLPASSFTTEENK